MHSHSRTPLALVVDPHHHERSDAEVAQGLAAGEDWAINEVWRRFAPLVISTAERALGSRSDAEDVTQEAFSRVFRKAETLRDPASLRSFVYSITLRTLRSHLRYRGLRAWLSFREPETLVDLRYATQDLEARELVRSFYRLLDRLSPRDRLVFLLRRVESMTIEEIATTLELSTSTVKRSFAHASKRLSLWVAADTSLAALLDSADDARPT
jgi:RNA polymerase sigma-70 factor (ECF subfamily)